MNGRFVKALCIAFTCLALFMQGCISSKVRKIGREIDRDLLEEINPGVTTYQDLTDLFGEPTKYKQKDEGVEVVIYTYREEKVPTYLGGLVEDETRKKAVTTSLEVTLKNGKVSSLRFKSSGDAQDK